MYIPTEVRDAALCFILYADDTVLFSEREQGLQKNAILFRAVHIQMEN